MNKRAAIIAGIAIVGLVGGFAVFGNKGGNTESSSSSEVVTITDGKGEVDVAKNPETIVSFDYGAVDILDNMGIDVDGLPKASIPKSLSKYNEDKYKDLGDLKEPDFEAINALNPDLIIISGRQEDMYDKFKEIAPTIYLSVDGAKYMEDFSRNMNTLGKIFDKEDFVTEQLSNIENEIEKVNKVVTDKKMNASTLMVNEGSLSAFSADSRYGIIYNQLGFKNVDPSIEASSHGQQVTFEYLIEKNPEYIFVVDRGDATGGDSTAKALFDNDLVKSTDAYKNDKIVYLSSQAWYVIAGGLSSTQVMIEDIANSIK